MITYQIAHTWDGSPLPKQAIVTITLSGQPNGELLCQIHAPFYNDPAPEQPAGSVWELWNHEVVELFFVGENGHYLEVELGPHGHYLLLQLDAPRSVTQRALPIDYQASIMDDRWTGIVTLPGDYLPKPITHFNLFAIHGIADKRTYQCYHPLPAEKPDFHQPHRFPKYPCESLTHR